MDDFFLLIASLGIIVVAGSCAVAAYTLARTLEEVRLLVTEARDEVRAIRSIRDNAKLALKTLRHLIPSLFGRRRS